MNFPYIILNLEFLILSVSLFYRKIIETYLLT
jgi:hypothetical protein